MFVVGSRGIPLVPRQFFPSSDRPELLVDLRLPEGASFAATLREAQRFEAVLERPTARSTTIVDFVGAGAPRFYLPLDQQLAAPNFAQFVITAKSVKEREQLARDLADRAIAHAIFRRSAPGSPGSRTGRRSAFRCSSA